MSRLDQQSEQQLVSRIATLRKAIDELRTAQRVGSTSVKLNNIVSGLTSDITVHVNYHDIIVVEFTYTPAELGGGGTGYMFLGVPSVVSTSGPGGVSIIRTYEVLPAVNGVQKFRIYLYGVSVGTNMDVNIKFTGRVFGTGTFTVAQL